MHGMKGESGGCMELMESLEDVWNECTDKINKLIIYRASTPSAA